MKSIAGICKKHGNSETGLMAILQDIQHEYGYLSEDHCETVSRSLGVPISRLYALATFYRAFRLVPAGKHTLCVCLGTACHVKGGGDLVSHFKDQWGLEPGQTSGDGRITLEVVRCVGCCGLAPVVVVNGRYERFMNRKKLDRVVGQCR
jgi:NADH:ubiquinone oxidoreductase subunit E